MSISLAIPKVGVQNSRSVQRGPESFTAVADALNVDVPTVASLRKFAAKFRFGARHREVRSIHNTDSQTGVAPSVSQSTQHRHAVPGTSNNSLRAEDVAQTQTTQPSLNLHSDNQHNKNDNQHAGPQVAERSEEPDRSAIAKSEASVTLGSAFSNAPSTHARSTVAVLDEIDESAEQPDEEGANAQPTTSKESDVGGDSGVDVGDKSAQQSDTSTTNLKPSSTSQQPAIATAPSVSTSGASSKGKEVVRKDRFRSFDVHVPRSKLERLKSIRFATPDSIKAEVAEYSAVDRMKLANFSQVLSSPTDRIELFGREMPLTRISLVLVKEASTTQANYICVHGLQNAVDITRFHTVMSQERYRPLYKPLRICYDTAKLSKVGYVERSDAELSKPGNPGILSPIVEAQDSTAEYSSGMHSYYRYCPVAADDTYCGALFQMLVDGQPWVSTLGGMIEVGGRMYVMACQHVPSHGSPTTAASSVAETVVEEDFAADVESPLVFATEDFSSTGVSSTLDESSSQPSTTVGDTFAKLSHHWKELSLTAPISTGPEWCLLPIEGHSILPNFVDRSIKTGSAADEPARHYLEQVSEPWGGCPAYVATGTDLARSGSVAGNSSFIIGGGTAGLLEVWTVILNDEQTDIKKGDSGSWVLDTSDPLQYRVIGSTVATSQGVVHFVRLLDQFYQIKESMGGSAQVSLAQSFRALVTCANLGFLSNDPKSDYYAEEALTTRVLEQMHNGWYLSGLKFFLGVDDKDLAAAVTGSSTTQLYLARRNVIKGLILRYGVRFLDGLEDPHTWLDCYSIDLQTSQRQIYEELIKSLRIAGKSELSGIATNAKISELSGIATSAKKSQLPQRRARKCAFGLTWSRNPVGISRRVLAGIVPIMVLAESLAAMAGSVAAVVMYAVEAKDSTQSLNMTVGKAAALGAGAGTISATNLIFQTLLIYLFGRYDWSVLFGDRILALSSTAKVTIFLVLIIASSFARTLLPTLWVSRLQGFKDEGTIIIAAAAAAAPSLLSAAAPSVAWYICRRKLSVNGTVPLEFTHASTSSWFVVYLAYSFPVIGFDSLAGYTFANVIQNSGLKFLGPSAATAGAAVFSILSALLVTCPAAFGIFRLYHQYIDSLRNSTLLDLQDLELRPRPSKDNQILENIGQDTVGGKAPTSVSGFDNFEKIGATLPPPPDHSQWSGTTIRGTSNPISTRDFATSSYGSSTAYTSSSYFGSSTYGGSSFAGTTLYSDSSVHDNPAARRSLPQSYMMQGARTEMSPPPSESKEQINTRMMHTLVHPILVELSADPPDPNRPRPNVERDSRVRQPPIVTTTYFTDVSQYLAGQPAFSTRFEPWLYEGS